MFGRTRAPVRAINAFKRYGSSSSHHEPVSKPIEISVTKVFGIAALAGAALVYKNHERTDEPLVKTALYTEQASGDRETLRNENYLKRYKTSFIKGLIRDKGGIGQRQYRRISDNATVPTVLIPTHSPYGSQFGQGIKTDALGPRQERIRVYAEAN